MGQANISEIASAIMEHGGIDAEAKSTFRVPAAEWAGLSATARNNQQAGEPRDGSMAVAARLP